MAQDIRCTVHDSAIPCAKCLARVTDNERRHKDCIDCDLEDALTALLIRRDVGKRKARSIAKDVLTLVRGREIRDEDD